MIRMRGRAQRREQHVARNSTSFSFFLPSLLRENNNKIKEKYRNKRAKTAVLIENKYNLMRKAYRNCAIVDFSLLFFSLYVWSQILGQWCLVLVLLIYHFSLPPQKRKHSWRIDISILMVILSRSIISRYYY